MAAFDNSNIVIDDDLNRLGSKEFDDYVAHVLCYEGQYFFTFNDQKFTLRKSNLMIIPTPQLFGTEKSSKGLKATCIYVKNQYLRKCTPKSNYDISGVMSLFENPIIPLDDKQFEQCDRDFDYMKYRLKDNTHHFKDEIMDYCTMVLFLDFFEFHVSRYSMVNVSLQSKNVMVGFIGMLQRGDFVKHRDISYYADKLCVTSKYLSEVCKSVSGKAANYWINRFAALRIREELLAREKTFTEIADEFEFSSPAYFTRFVQRNLGASPSSFRE